MTYKIKRIVLIIVFILLVIIINVKYEDFIKLYNKNENNIKTLKKNIDDDTARKIFYDKMSINMKSLNMQHISSFKNASGLEEGAGNATIQDLVRLAVFAQNNKTISNIWKNPKYSLKSLNSNRSEILISTVFEGMYSSDLSNYYNIIGGKTGSSNVYNLIVVVQNKTTGTKYVGAVSSDTEDDSSNNRFSNAKILFDIAVRLDEDSNADISDLEEKLKSDRASVCILPENTNEFLTTDLFESKYHLYTKGANDVFPYASVQKVISILTILDYNINLDEKITIVESDIQRGSGPVLVVGDQYTIEDAIYGMLLPSSNSFSEALSRVVGAKIYLNNF